DEQGGKCAGRPGAPARAGPRPATLLIRAPGAQDVVRVEHPLLAGAVVLADEIGQAVAVHVAEPHDVEEMAGEVVVVAPVERGEPVASGELRRRVRVRWAGAVHLVVGDPLGAVRGTMAQQIVEAVAVDVAGEQRVVPRDGARAGLTVVVAPGEWQGRLGRL